MLKRALSVIVPSLLLSASVFAAQLGPKIRAEIRRDARSQPAYQQIARPSVRVIAVLPASKQTRIVHAGVYGVRQTTGNRVRLLQARFKVNTLHQTVQRQGLWMGAR